MLARSGKGGVTKWSMCQYPKASPKSRQIWPSISRSASLFVFPARRRWVLPVYLFSRSSIGSSAAMFLMIVLMLPFFFFAMYERDDLPLEKVLKNILRTRFLYLRVWPYKTENFYALLGARKKTQPIAKQQKGRKARRQKA